VSTAVPGADDMRVEMHGRSCSCRGGSWVVFGDATARGCRLAPWEIAVAGFALALALVRPGLGTPGKKAKGKKPGRR